MKRIFGIGLLTAAFLFTLCACGKSGTEQSASAQKPATSADVTDAGPEQQATLYLMTVIVRAYFPVGQPDQEALAAVHEPGRMMTVPLILLTVLGVVLALCSDPIIRFLELVGGGYL